MARAAKPCLAPSASAIPIRHTIAAGPETRNSSESMAQTVTYSSSPARVNCTPDRECCLNSSIVKCAVWARNEVGRDAREWYTSPHGVVFYVSRWLITQTVNTEDE